MTAKTPNPERVAEILSQPTCSVPQAGYVLGLGRDGSYEAAKKGQIKTLEFNSRKRVATAWLKRVLEGEAVAR